MEYRYDYYDQDLTSLLWADFHTPSNTTEYLWNLSSRSTLTVTGSNGSSTQTEGGEDHGACYYSYGSIPLYVLCGSSFRALR